MRRYLLITAPCVAVIVSNYFLIPHIEPGYMKPRNIAMVMDAVAIVVACVTITIGSVHATFSVFYDHIREKEPKTELMPGVYCPRCEPDGLGVAAFCTNHRGK